MDRHHPIVLAVCRYYVHTLADGRQTKRPRRRGSIRINSVLQVLYDTGNDLILCREPGGSLAALDVLLGLPGCWPAGVSTLRSGSGSRTMGLGLFSRVPDVKNQIAMQVAVSLCGPHSDANVGGSGACLAWHGMALNKASSAAAESVQARFQVADTSIGALAAVCNASYRYLCVWRCSSHGLAAVLCWHDWAGMPV